MDREAKLKLAKAKLSKFQKSKSRKVEFSSSNELVSNAKIQETRIVPNNSEQKNVKVDLQSLENEDEINLSEDMKQSDFIPQTLSSSAKEDKDPAINSKSTRDLLSSQNEAFSSASYVTNEAEYYINQISQLEGHCQYYSDLYQQISAENEELLHAMDRLKAYVVDEKDLDTLQRELDNEKAKLQSKVIELEEREKSFDEAQQETQNYVKQVEESRYHLELELERLRQLQANNTSSIQLQNEYHKLIQDLEHERNLIRQKEHELNFILEEADYNNRRTLEEERKKLIAELNDDRENDLNSSWAEYNKRMDLLNIRDKNLEERLHGIDIREQELETLKTEIENDRRELQNYEETLDVRHQQLEYRERQVQILEENLMKRQMTLEAKEQVVNESENLPHGDEVPSDSPYTLQEWKDYYESLCKELNEKIALQKPKLEPNVTVNSNLGDSIQGFVNIVADLAKLNILN